MTADLFYLKELGYSDDEIQSYQQSWAEGILSYLSENQTYVLENMRFLQDDFEPDLLLKLPVFYPDAFVLYPQTFRKYLSLLKTEFPDGWVDIIEKQFWGYDGIAASEANGGNETDPVLYQPYLETIGTNREENVHKALDSLRHPSSRVYDFIDKLKTETGITLSAEDLPEEVLPDLEVAKYEVVDNVCFLQQQGISDCVIEEILICNPIMMCGSESELDDMLKSAFGKDYSKKLEEMTLEDIDETLVQL